MTSNTSLLRPSEGFGGTGEQGHLFQGNRGTKAIFRGEQGNKDKCWGTWNIRKQIFDFRGTGEQVNLFQGNEGTGTPSWEGLIVGIVFANIVGAVSPLSTESRHERTWFLHIRCTCFFTYMRKQRREQFVQIKADADFVFFYESKTCGTYRQMAKEADRAYICT